MSKYEPRKDKKIVLYCPFKFSCPENGIDCVQDKCALWLPIQKACAIQVLARGFEPKFKRRF